jgi:hypothetical protein
MWKIFFVGSHIEPQWGCSKGPHSILSDQIASQNWFSPCLRKERCVFVSFVSLCFLQFFFNTTFIHEQLFNTFSSKLQPICFTFEFEFNSIIYLHLVLIQLHWLEFEFNSIIYLHLVLIQLHWLEFELNWIIYLHLVLIQLHWLEFE